MLLDSRNTLMIAAAGSGKTTYLVREAIVQKEGNILITTYTENNELEIRNKLIEINGSVPSNVTVKTWFSLLIQHGVKPYQGSIVDEDIKGLVLVNGQSTRYMNEQREPRKYFFTPSMKIYSDKLSKLVIRCNERSNGKVIERLTRTFTHIFVDEVQDLAGFDLEIIKLLFLSASRILLAGDPRQVTYLTHHEKTNSGYSNGMIEKYLFDKCKRIPYEIDANTLNLSHRNNQKICDFASKLYPSLQASQPCSCAACRSAHTDHTGIFIVDPNYIEKYKATFSPSVLRYKGANEGEWNFGAAKGLGFDRVLLYPTTTIISYLTTGRLKKIVSGKQRDAFDIAKFYVAVTRARQSVAIVCQISGNEKFIDGIQIYR